MATQIIAAGDCTPDQRSRSDQCDSELLRQCRIDHRSPNTRTGHEGQVRFRFRAAPTITHVDAINTYDDDGRLVSTKNGSTDDDKRAETKTEYLVPGHVGDLDQQRRPGSDPVTNAENQVTTQILNKEWGSVVQETNAAGAKTDHEYDSLGRVTQIWVPGRKRPPVSRPTYKYDYRLTNANPNVVTTQTLNAFGDYTVSKAMFDGLMRPRETQSLAANPDGGRMITEKRYDSHGWLESERGPYYNEAKIDDALVQASPSSFPAYTDYEYDRAGRATKTTLMSHGSEKWHTSTEYGGDRTTVTPLTAAPSPLQSLTPAARPPASCSTTRTRRPRRTPTLRTTPTRHRGSSRLSRRRMNRVKRDRPGPTSTTSAAGKLTLMTRIKATPRPSTTTLDRPVTTTMPKGASSGPRTTSSTARSSFTTIRHPGTPRQLGIRHPVGRLPDVLDATRQRRGLHDVLHLRRRRQAHQLEIDAPGIHGRVPKG